jgi:hypothetical protein
MLKQPVGAGRGATMLVDPSSSAAGSAVTGAIRQASQATGTSFNYLLATAQVESGLNPQAGASTSSARGLFQFIDQTWLATVKQYGPALGYGQYADAITQTASGHYQVNDAAMRGEILKLRNNPTANAVMAGAFTKANAETLASKLGREPSEGELYIAHFLGVGGAARLISAAEADPNASAASYFPHAARANSSIFYNHATGTTRSLAQVRDILTARYDVARARPSDPSATPTRVADSSIPIPPMPIPSVPDPNTTATANIGKPPAIAAVAAQPKVTSVAVPPRTPIAALDAPAVKMVKTTRVTVAASKPPVVAPDTAGITQAFADAAPPAPPAPKPAGRDNQVFHGLFQDTDRAGPVAAVVSELWGVPNPAASRDMTPMPTPPSGGNMFDLFKDPKNA